MKTVELTIRILVDDERNAAQVAADAEHALAQGPFRAAQTVGAKTVFAEDARQPMLLGFEDEGGAR